MMNSQIRDSFSYVLIVVLLAISTGRGVAGPHPTSGFSPAGPVGVAQLSGRLVE